jgi:hypothetical protein
MDFIKIIWTILALTSFLFSIVYLKYSSINKYNSIISIVFIFLSLIIIIHIYTQRYKEITRPLILFLSIIGIGILIYFYQARSGRH